VLSWEEEITLVLAVLIFWGLKCKTAGIYFYYYWNLAAGLNPKYTYPVT
jgi:hypothetical protein